MSPYPALDRLQIGCVKYLNARPLIHAYPGPVRFDHPSALARDIARHTLDAALVPIFEALGTRRYTLVDGAAIASDGPVYSVFLAHAGALESVRTVALDPASLTSVHLLQVVLAEFHGLRPSFVDERNCTDLPDARLLIGNQAIAFRQETGAACEYLDLGEEWTRQTGLPFVYALWLLREGVPEAGVVAAEFRKLKQASLEQMDEIISSEATHTAEFARRYLTHHIRFELGEREKAGILRFRGLLQKHGFLPDSLPPLTYV